MEIDFPPPGPSDRLERLSRWMRARKWRQWLVLISVSLLSVMILFPAWFAVAFLLDSPERNAGAVALNLVLVFFLAIVGLAAMHRGMYRWFWHIDRKRAAGTLPFGDQGPPFGSEETAPPPCIHWPWTSRLRHAAIYVAGILTLLYAFAPYDHQLAIVRCVLAHSAGRSSAGSLNTLLFGYLPMVVLATLTLLLTWRQMRRRDAGLLDASGKLLLEAELSWLFSFGAAFTVTAFLCRWAGSMIIAYL
jgi:hypothetical protein